MSLSQQILKKIDSQKEQIFEFLQTIININSFTDNLNGIEEVSNKIMEFSSDFGINFEKYFPDKEKSRFHLIYNKHLNKNFYGIIGHIDTVHPPEDNFLNIIEEGDKLIGPGVNDMKGGIVTALFSLFTLINLKISNLPVKIIFNTDEEVGSKTSRDLIINEMKNADAVFVFEAGRLPGNKIISSRKGVMELKLTCFGKSSHAGESPQSGINSIVEISDKIIKLFNLNGSIDGLTVQPGVIQGGIARNVVPKKSECTVDIRFQKRAEKNYINNIIHNICSEKLLPGSEIKYTLDAHRMPMEMSSESEKLIQKYIDTGKELGYDIGTTSSGGVSDANLLSEYCPVLDGLGPIGEFCHTKQEYIIKNSLIDRIKIFTYFLYNLIAEPF